MAWNEPGGSKGKDPWGGGNEQGPPDLDEMLKKLQEKFGGLFGGRGEGGGEGGGGIPQAGPIGIGIVVAILLLIWALSGIYIVDEGRRGVVTQFGAFHEITGPGPHWHARFIQNVEKVNVDQIRSVELGFGDTGDSIMLTQDENIIELKFSLQYKVKDPRDYLFNVRDPDSVLRQAAESAIREVVGKSTLDKVITTGRTEIAASTMKLLQQTLDHYKVGLELTSVNMQKAQAPEQVQDAFADAVKAREDEQRLKNEAEAYANDVLPRARGAAARRLEEANAYKSKVIADAEGEAARFESVLVEYKKSPVVTRKRLYIDSLESVMERSTTVMVDVEGGNNLLYLPLDQIMKRQQPLNGFNSSGMSLPSPPLLPSSSSSNKENIKRMRDNLRSREVR
ncbi:MAG TPA: FtsH protease activity modulator HflK [Gammaproteobacteria bacterium]|nr:FtsH protease activity modulator HflK [Gammaproteobacteria bacterium]